MTKTWKSRYIEKVFYHCLSFIVVGIQNKLFWRHYDTCVIVSRILGSMELLLAGLSLKSRTLPQFLSTIVPHPQRQFYIQDMLNRNSVCWAFYWWSWLNTWMMKEASWNHVLQFDTPLLTIASCTDLQTRYPLKLCCSLYAYLPFHLFPVI